MNEKKIINFLDSVIDKFQVPCFTFACKNKGKDFFYAKGFKDESNTKEVSVSDSFAMYSITKIATVTAVFKLIEEGKLTLDDEVSKFLPSYKNMQIIKDGKIFQARNTMKIKHLLTMQAGMNYIEPKLGVKRLLKEKGDDATTLEIANALGESPLSFEPGEQFYYSLCHNVLGGVVEAVTGQKFSEYLNDLIFEPLEMKSVTFHPSKKALGDMPCMYSFDKKTRKQDVFKEFPEIVFNKNFDAGSGGLFGNAADYVKFTYALANGGKSTDGYLILKPETLDMMRTPSLTPFMQNQFKEYFPLFEGFTYGYGVKTFVKKPFSLEKPGDFGWYGKAGALAIIAPEQNLSCVYLQHVMNSEEKFMKIHNNIRKLLLEE